MSKYTVTVEYREGSRHSIVETWKCAGEKALKKTLAQVLDTAVDADGFPTEPDRAKLERGLRHYAGVEFVDAEFARMKKAYRLYGKLTANGIGRGALSVSGKIDSRATVFVELEI